MQFVLSHAILSLDERSTKEERLMYYDFSVDIPYDKGKVYKVFRKARNATYIELELASTYLKEKQYNVTKRAQIGKLCSGDKDKMNPNENYFKLFPDTVVPEFREGSYRSCCLKIGAYMVIKKVIEWYGLEKLLNEVIKDRTGLFLDLVAFLIITEDNAAQYYPDFAFGHPLFSNNMRIYSDSSISRFLQEISIEQRVKFLNEWNNKMDHRQRIYVSYDSSNINCQAGDIDLVEHGHAKLDTGLPVINKTIAYDKTNSVPLFYEEYPGSIIDISQFEHMISKVEAYGYKYITFILDRGYFSKDNITCLEKKGYEFIIMVKGMRELVSNIVESKRGTFETYQSCSIRSYKAYGTTVVSHLFADDTKDRYLHIFYNPLRQAKEREKLESKLEALEKSIQNNIGNFVTVGSGYKDYFDFYFDKDGRLQMYKKKDDVVTKQLNHCGYFVIATSRKMTAQEALILYKGRDCSEKLYSGEKTFLGGRSLRAYSKVAASSKMFIEFVALIIRNRIYSLLKQEMLKHEKKSNYMTVPKALKELEKIEMVRRTDGTYRLDHAVTATQKAILGAFGLSDKDVRESAEMISKLLKDGGSLTDTVDEKQEEGDDDYGSDADDYLC